MLTEIIAHEQVLSPEEESPSLLKNQNFLRTKRGEVPPKTSLSFGCHPHPSLDWGQPLWFCSEAERSGGKSKPNLTNGILN